jgi:molybdate transport repressor ModE-like protein
MTIKRIHISPSWVFEDDKGQRVDPQIFKLLAALHTNHKLTEAAKILGISYRHSWNLLNKWSEFFGGELATTERGRGATLTPLGEKLLWAEQRATARFEPQMKNLASELNIDIQRLLERSGPQLRLHASHGYAVALLPQHCDQLELDIQYKTSIEALSALNQGLCDIAGFHLPSELTIATQQQDYLRHLDNKKHCIVRFISRQMGLHLPKGNPKNIISINDLTRPDITFINRNCESGSRVLFDQLLKNASINQKDINGYQTEEFTHSAVAAHVGSGMADTGFGIETAAHQFGLDFLPVARENYLFVCERKKLSSPAFELFTTMLRGEPFQQDVATLAGYSAKDCGLVTSIDKVFGMKQQHANWAYNSH